MWKNHFSDFLANRNGSLGAAGSYKLQRSIFSGNELVSPEHSVIIVRRKNVSAT